MFTEFTGIELVGGNADIGTHFTQHLNNTSLASAQDTNANLPSQGVGREAGLTA